MTKNLSEVTGTWSSDAPTGDYIRFVLAIADKATGYELMCDSLKVSPSIIPSVPTEEAISGFTNNNAIYIGLLASRLSGDLSTATARSNAFKAYLHDNDIQIAYPLATPTDLETEPQNVRLFKGYNRVSNDGEITMEYCQDIGRILKQLINYPSLPTSDGYYRLHVSHNGDELIYDWSTAQ